MRFKKPNSWSLDSKLDLLPLSIGSAVGIGNFLFLPGLYLSSGPWAVLSAHLVSLLLLGAPLLVAEMLWGRWLLRPFSESFAVLDRRWRYLGFLGLFVVIDICPPYLLELARLILALGQVVSGHTNGALGLHEEVLKAPLEIYLLCLVFLAFCLLLLLRPTRRLPHLMKGLLLFSFSAWTILSLHVLEVWGYAGLHESLHWDFSRIRGEDFLQIIAFSIFTLSAGMGVHYTFVYYASQKTLGDEANEDLWRKPGVIFRMALGIVLVDFISSCLVLVLISPFLSMQLSSDFRDSSNSYTLLFDWLPQILGRLSNGHWWVFFYLLSLLSVGLAAFLSLLEFATFHLQSVLRWSRRKALFWIFGIGVFLTALPLLRIFERKMNEWSSHLLMPASALALSIAVGWGMPARAQAQILGRGPLLDGLLLLWRHCIRWIIPAFLIFYIVHGLFS